MIIQVAYIAKWQLKTDSKYKWTECKKLINCKTGKEVTKTMKGNKAGYYINRIFTPLSEIKNIIELIKFTECPF